MLLKAIRKPLAPASIKWITARYATTCGCGKPICVGDRIGLPQAFNQSNGRIWIHFSCERCANQHAALGKYPSAPFISAQAQLNYMLNVADNLRTVGLPEVAEKYDTRAAELEAEENRIASDSFNRRWAGYKAEYAERERQQEEQAYLKEMIDEESQTLFNRTRLDIDLT